MRLLITREHILDEIKRTAAENGGMPLGRERFVKEIGIKVYDIGRYWARWSDAQREAGFNPNEMQAAYSNDFLLEKLVAFMRELGRFPTAPELRLKNYNDPSFPSLGTYEKFGRRPQLAEKIIEYCRDRDGYDDIVSLCAQVKGKEKPIKIADLRSVTQFGFVYLLRSGRYYKIGKTNAVGRRERELAIQLPEKTSKIHSIKTDDPGGIEAYWHKRFESKRKHGEWFELSASDVSAFRRRKFM